MGLSEDPGFGLRALGSGWRTALPTEISPCGWAGTGSRLVANL